MTASSSPWNSLAGKTIWITGGTGYLGSAITEALDQSADKTLCLDLPGKAEMFVRERKLTNTVPITCDVNDANTLPAAIEQLISQHGVPDGLAHLAFASSSGRTLGVCRT